MIEKGNSNIDNCFNNITKLVKKEDDKLNNKKYIFNDLSNFLDNYNYSEDNDYIYKCYINVSNNFPYIYESSLLEYFGSSDIELDKLLYNKFIKVVNNETICDKIKTMSDKSLMELAVEHENSNIKYLYFSDDIIEKISNILNFISRCGILVYLSKTNNKLKEFLNNNDFILFNYDNKNEIEQIHDIKNDEGLFKEYKKKEIKKLEHKISVSFDKQISSFESLKNIL